MGTFLLIIVVVIIIAVVIKNSSVNKQDYDTEDTYPDYEPISDSAAQAALTATPAFSKSFHKAALSAARAMLRFRDGLEEVEGFETYINGEEWIKGLDDGPGKEFHNPRLNGLLLADAMSIFKKLGHDLWDAEAEILPAYLLCMLIEDEENEVSYEVTGAMFNLRLNKIRTALNPYYEASLTGTEEKYFFALTQLLDSFSPQWSKKYLVLLYRFASVIAKADGSVSPHESQWLAGLMSLSQKTEHKESNVSGADKAPAQELNTLIGLTRVKEEVNKLRNFIKIQKQREDNGLKTSPISYHCVFIGNPGTGKTTVARIIASIYKELGILEKGHLVETDRSGLVAEYVGQTAVKTNKIIDSALDGVLFIDEAYSLVQGGREDYGMEAISTLLKRMEDDRKRLVVILAGYSNEMKTFIDANPGLQSRFNRYIHFDDYNGQELAQIFKINASKNEYLLSLEAEQKMQQVIDRAVDNKDNNFGNARYVRNLFEKTLENQATRLSTSDDISREALQTILPQDIAVL